MAEIDLIPKKTRAKRACPWCGFVRTVTVWVTKDGEDAYKPPLCEMCKARSRSMYYSNVAAKWYNRYRALKEKRDARLAKKRSKAGKG